MTALQIGLIVAGTAAGAFVSGVSGFAFGLVALGVWSWGIEPQTAAVMVILGSLAAQALTMGKLRLRPQGRRLAPFLIGGLIGAPFGVMLLDRIDMPLFKAGVGGVMIVYASIMLLSPRLPRTPDGGPAADGVVGLIGGVMGGLAGLCGVVLAMWCGLKNWSKDEQRAVYQPFNLSMHIASTTALLLSGALHADILPILALMIPALAAGTLAGTRLYARMDQDAFRRNILILLIFSGCALLSSLTSSPTSH